VGADDGRDAAVEIPAQADLLARRLGVHVDEDVVDLPLEAAEDRVDLDECRAAGAEVEVPREVDDPEAHAAALHDREAVARLRPEIVGRPQDPLLRVEVREDLLAVIGVVSERDDVHARREELVGDLRRDPEAPGDVLGVDDDEGRVVALAQGGEEPQQGPAAESADEVADEEDGRGRVRHGAYSRARER